MFVGENIDIAGFTYAEYARRGFFELVAVAVVTMGLLLVLHVEEFVLQLPHYQRRLNYVSDAVAAGARAIVRQSPDKSLTTVCVLGGDELRSVLAERQSRIESIRLTADHFLVTNGSSGAIDLICDAFLTPGDVVLAENPAFAGTLRTIRGHLCEVVGVSIGDGTGFLGSTNNAVGLVGTYNGSQAREVMITVEQWEQMSGQASSGVEVGFVGSDELVSVEVHGVSLKGLEICCSAAIAPRPRPQGKGKPAL